MAREKKPEPEVKPDLALVTFSDMMTLMLTFFILLFTMSEIRKDKISKTMRAFQAQFGVLPKQKASVQIFLQAQRLTDTDSFVLRRGPPGKHTAVTIIDEGKKTKIVIGGSELFRPGETELSPSGKRILQEEIAPDLKGYRNRIEIRGHTAPVRAGEDMPFEDLWEVGYRRSLSVMRFLVATCGLDERRFRVVSCADNEPVDSNLKEAGRNRNRRVEIIMTEELIPEIDEADQR